MNINNKVMGNREDSLQLNDYYAVSILMSDIIGQYAFECGIDGEFQSE